MSPHPDELLTDWILDELKAEERRRFEALLAADPQLAARAIRRRELFAALRREIESDEPIALRRKFPKRPSFWPAATAVVAGLLLLLTLTRPTLHETPPRDQASIGLANRTIRSAGQWLRSRQEPDGSWDASRLEGNDAFTPGLTALAALALNGNPAEDRAASLRACRWLAEQIAADGTLMTKDPKSSLYNQALAALALTQSQEAVWRPSRDRLINAIVATQHSGGGWGYLPESPPNTALTVWQVLTLAAARDDGRQDLGDDLERAGQWLESVFDAGGRAGYERPGHFPNGPECLTAMAVWSLRLTGNAARTLLPNEGPAMEIIDFSKIFFLTAVGHPPREIVAQLARRQIPQGPERGSWRAEDPWATAGGRLYATALATLTLRSLPQIHD